MNELLPWHETAFRALVQRRQQDRLPHALLLTGPAGTGKRALAETLSAALLCEQATATGLACGQCHSCHLFAAGSHPDFHAVQPEEGASVIKIDQIRALIETVAVSPHYARGRILLLDPADSLNRAAANSLLKTLEEPPPGSRLILISARPSLLPATIRSRCQQLSLPMPSLQQARDWLAPRVAADQAVEVLLALAGGAPLQARALAETGQLAQRQELLEGWSELARGQADPVRLAASWVKPDAEWPLRWMYGWVADMIRLRSDPDSLLLNQDARSGLQNLAQKVDLKRLYGLLDRIGEGLRLLDTQVNAQTIIEEILLYWSNLPRQNAGHDRTGG